MNFQAIIQREELENTGNQIILNLLLPVMDKLSFTILGEMFLQDYQHTHTFFGMKRSDRTYYGAAGMRWEKQVPQRVKS